VCAHTPFLDVCLFPAAAKRKIMSVCSGSLCVCVCVCVLEIFFYYKQNRVVYVSVTLSLSLSLSHTHTHTHTHTHAHIHTHTHYFNTRILFWRNSGKNEDISRYSVDMLTSFLRHLKIFILKAPRGIHS